MALLGHLFLSFLAKMDQIEGIWFLFSAAHGIWRDLIKNLIDTVSLISLKIQNIGQAKFGIVGKLKNVNIILNK